MAESKDGEKPPLFKVGKAKTILYEDHEHLGDRAHSDIGEVDDLTAKRIRSTPAGKKD